MMKIETQTTKNIIDLLKRLKYKCDESCLVLLYMKIHYYY